MTPSIVLDTNVLVSGLWSRRGASFKLLSLLGSDAFQLHLSVPLVLEYEEVLFRKQRQLGLSQEDVRDVLDYLCHIAQLHEVYFLWRPTLRDPNDDMILELAVTAGCDHVITYNRRDFIGVEAFGLTVMNSREFLQHIGQLP